MTTTAQLVKAAELIEDGGVRPFGTPGLFLVVASNGRRHYVVNANSETCTCPAGEHGRACYHVVAVRMLSAV